jgi:DNA-binding MarR family transcriptional regulator
MNKSAFNPDFQASDTTSKIIVGFSRISEALKSLLWEYAKKNGLSPIQIQLLIFLRYHKVELSTISYLAKEFNITKATVSDAVKSLETKSYIVKDYSNSDKRSYTIKLSNLGIKLVKETEKYATPIEFIVDKLETENKEQLLSSIIEIVTALNKADVLAVQRSCYSCKFYERSKNLQHCRFLNKDLRTKDIRLDCNEFKAS